MKIFSAFCGIGGFELGIKQAFKDMGLTPPKFIGCSETDRFAASVYERNLEGVKNYGDIRNIKAEELPDFDCLLGGFPCQAFSLAGKRRGFEDTRGTLFFELARILRAKQPRLFVFENVKGLLSHGGGTTFKTIIATLAELGYDCEWQVLNSKDFGVPQNRERIIIVRHLGGRFSPKVFPISPSAQEVVWGCDAGADECAANDRTCIRIPEATKKGYAEAFIGDSVNLSYLGCRTKRGRVGHAIAHTLTASNMSQYTPCRNADGILTLRRLTPRECERLHGFPDDWTRYGKDGENISDTQRYKMCGNAITVNVVREVFRRLIV